MLSLNEFHLEKIIRIFLWNPLNTIGNKLNFLNLRKLFFLFLSTYFVGIIALYYKNSIPNLVTNYLPEVFAGIGLVFVFKAFSERKSPFVAWLLIVFNHFWIVLAILFNEKVSYYEISLYITGIVIAGTIGYIALLKLKTMEKRILLSQHSMF